MFIICADEALDPERVTRICHENPQEEVYCLPWVKTKEGLEENLRLNKGKPNRMFPCEENREDRGGEYLEFDESLGSDALGRMAYSIAHGHPIINEIMRCPCDCSFYGRVIGVLDSEDPVYLVRSAVVEKLLPQEPISLKWYAATSVAVRVKNTKQFELASGWDSPDISVLISSDYLPGLSTFLRFHRMMTGADVVPVSRKTEGIEKKLPVFEYNKGYRPENFGEKCGA